MKKHLVAAVLVGLLAAGLWAQEAPAPAPEYTKGLGYTLNKAGTEYSVGIGSVETLSNDDTGSTPAPIIIPPTYKGKPVTAIAKEGFKHLNFQQVILPESIVTIGESAFENCKLSEITIPSSVKVIGNRAFATNRIRKLVLGASVEVIGDAAFELNTIDGDLVFPATLKTIGAGAFYKNGAPSSGYGDWGITSVVFNSASLTIGDAAFAACKKLKTVTFNGKLTSLGIGAFTLTRISELVLPEGLTKIGFATVIADNLTKIVIPASVKDVSSCAFLACYPATVQFLGTKPPKVSVPDESVVGILYDLSHEEIGNFGDITRFKVLNTKNLQAVVVPKGASAAYEGDKAWGVYGEWMKDAE